MRTYFITANDTDSGKTQVMGMLAREFSAQGQSVQVIKPVDCGNSGDAQRAFDTADNPLVTRHTFFKLPAPMAPQAAENQAAGVEVTIIEILKQLDQLPECDIRLIEGAGGIAVPVEANGLDWRDFAEALQPDGIIAVVDNRLGAINQSYLLHAYLGDLQAGFFLSATQVIDPAIHQSNLSALAAKGIHLLAHLDYNSEQITWSDQSFFQESIDPPAPTIPSLQYKLKQRRAQDIFRELKPRSANTSELNLADNDYLGLRQHPKLITAATNALALWGSSASASPLISGYTQAHADLEQTISQWYGHKPTLLWNSGYAANQSVLKLFIQSEDLVFADRLVHNSLIAGIQQSGARLIRFQHNDLEHLERLLKKYAQGERKLHLVTESVYSMDGDYPDLIAVAELKSKYGFQWFLDEAHAVGWYGQTGSGLAEAHGVVNAVDILTGTLGKALASSGAYTLFNESWMRDYCINEAAEFIYSTYFPPASAAAAMAAIEYIQNNSSRPHAQAAAASFREQIIRLGWDTAAGDSPIVPIVCGRSTDALRLADSFRSAGIRVAAIRPPTVPEGSARVRISLKSTLKPEDYCQLLECLSSKPIPAHA